MATPQVAAPARAASPSSPSLRKRMSLFTRRRTADKRRGSEGDTSMPPVPPLPSLQRQWTLPEQERQALTSPIEAGPVPSSTPTSPSKPTTSASQQQQPRPALQQAHTFPSTSSPDLEEQQQRFAAHPYLTSAALYPLRGHGRVRSHFSIPDVMVTGCEEEGEETYFEVRLSEDKRRTHLFNHVEPVAIPSGPLSAPLVSPGDILDDGAMTPTPSKRTRKSSLPLIFGRSSTPKPSKASTETHPPRSRSPYQQPAFSSSGSLPSASSRDSLPSTGSTPRTPPLTDGYASSPPDTPSSLINGGGSEATFSPPPLLPSTRPLVPISKKERKLREREEQALMKELARVDKMVRSHDAKLRKAEMQNQHQKQKQAGTGGTKARDTLKRMTRFSVSTKGSAGASSATVQAAGSGVVRRSSVNVAKKDGAAASSSSRRGKEAPQQGVATTSSSTGPIRPARPPPLFSSQSEAMEIRQSLDLQSQQHKQQHQQQHSQARPTPRETRERTKDSDESERPTFTVQEWQDLAEAHFGVDVAVTGAQPQQLVGGAVSSAAVAGGQMTPDGSWELQQPQLAGILEQAGLAELCRQEKQQATTAAAAGSTRRNSRSAVGRVGSQRRASRTGSVLLDGRRRSRLLMGQTQTQQRNSDNDDADGQWEEEDTLTAAALAPFIAAGHGDGEETPRARTPAAVPAPTTAAAVPAQTSPTHFPSLPLLDLGKRMSKGDFASLAAAFEDGAGDGAAAPSGGLGMIWPAEGATSGSPSRSNATASPAAVSRPPRRAPVAASTAAPPAKASNNGGPSPSSSIDSISSRTSSSSSTDGDSSSSSTSSTPHSSTCHSSSSSTRARREARSSTPPTTSSSGGGVQEKQQFKSKAAVRAAKAAEAAKAGAKVAMPMPSAASPTGVGMGMGRRMIKRPSPPPL